MTYYNWNKFDFLPKKDLEAWHHYVPGATGHTAVFDYSGNDRTLYSDPSNTSYLVSDVAGGQPGLYLPGDQSPLVYSGSITIQHIFCVCSYELATFPNNNGILSAPSIYGLLIGGGAATTKFFDTPEFPGKIYRKNGVTFAENNMQAPMNQQFSVLELILAEPITLTGLQIGQDRGFTDRKWTGYFFENISFSSIKNETERKRIYEYFAMRYQIWRQNSSGTNIFPFVADRVRSVEREREHYLSTPYSGAKKALVRSINREMQLPFNLRHPSEFEAAEKFHDQHYPLTDFIYEDYNYYPFKNRTLNFNSSLKEKGSDVSHRFNYSFDVVETN